MVRQHQGAAEREAAGRQKSFADALTGSLLRGEARSLKHAASGAKETNKGRIGRKEGDRVDWSIEGEDDEQAKAHEKAGASGEGGQAMDAREKGLKEWRLKLEERFVGGDDREFDYERVDMDEELDGGWREMEREERWFAEEEEHPNGGGGGGEPRGHQLEGQTGVQDF